MPPFFQMIDGRVSVGALYKKTKSVGKIKISDIFYTVLLRRGLQ